MTTIAVRELIAVCNYYLQIFHEYVPIPSSKLRKLVKAAEKQLEDEPPKAESEKDLAAEDAKAFLQNADAPNWWRELTKLEQRLDTLETKLKIVMARTEPRNYETGTQPRDSHSGKEKE
jgi:hypothetical protein